MPKVGIIMGSESDLPVMKAAAEILAEFQISYEINIISAHRTPLQMVAYARQARGRGLKVIIAGAGGAAHLPGMVAALTTLPVIGVPVLSRNSLLGLDSILSILQMPAGIPVGTVALDNAQNAGLLAAEIIGAYEPEVAEKLALFRTELENKVLQARQRVSQTAD
jgi:5-(carboxyamino)imidazole ribonucleotide mutase